MDSKLFDFEIKPLLNFNILCKESNNAFKITNKKRVISAILLKKLFENSNISWIISYDMLYNVNLIPVKEIIKSIAEIPFRTNEYPSIPLYPFVDDILFPIKCVNKNGIMCKSRKEILIIQKNIKKNKYLDAIINYPFKPKYMYKNISWCRRNKLL